MHGYDGLYRVKIKNVDSTIDNNIQSKNIKYDTSILGVTGRLSGLTQDEYLQALELQNQILGYDIYVTRNKLVINTATVTDDKIGIDGEVIDKKLKVN